MGGSAVDVPSLSTSSRSFVAAIVAGVTVVPNRSGHRRLNERGVRLQPGPRRRLYNTSESHRSFSCTVSSGIAHESLNLLLPLSYHSHYFSWVNITPVPLCIFFLVKKTSSISL